jgi:hypothetical protein
VYYEWAHITILLVVEARLNEVTRLPCVATVMVEDGILVVETHLLGPYFT